METVWQKEYTLRAGDFDKFDRIFPSAVLNLFQDAAGQHGEALGVGFESMLARSYLWVLTHVRFRILSPVFRHQTVVVKTWPLKPGRLSYRREYSIENTMGEILIEGSSDWVVIDSQKRQFIAAPDLYPFQEGFCEKLVFADKTAKIKSFEADGTVYPVNTGYSELDMNNHVNNTKYADYVLDAVNPGADDVLESFQMDYRKEVVCDTKLSILKKREKKLVFIRGENGDGDIMFACRLMFR